ncbi:hypothetical protein [Puniceicoccus vermicola]|uniref:XRE family transcriptional regulator n=1 Tax=Puniceicoccus vermicola TaxID=388746 RepID=A0A7X1E3W6_9BACT|nr:hypothetical protein [Puniceicoccus vermicola]MBC2601368.1 hypothetical protein [Puniceicoccus vermicola]
MEIERNLGKQPIAAVMEEEGLRAHDLVEASADSLTHKMVSRACKGRRLTPNTKRKVINALEKKTGKSFPKEDLFNY